MSKKSATLASKYLCPLCGGGMVEKTGKFGYFLGCLKYPYCRGGRDLDGSSWAEPTKKGREKQKRLSSPPGQMSRVALLGRLRRQGVLAISASFLFKRR